MTDKKAMAKRFSEGWHEGIKIDASDIMLLSQAAEALAQRTAPACPECKAEVLYECVACSSNNYPPQRTEQEPVAWYYPDGSPDQCTTNKAYAEMEPAWTPLYTHPPQRTEPPQQKKVWTFWDLSGGDIADAIKAKLKEKNT